MHPKLKALGLALFLLVLGGCNSRVVRPGETQQHSETIALDGAQQVRVEIKSALSNLTLTGGATGLMEGDFSYNLPELKPVVNYNVSGSEGVLTVGPIDEKTNIIPAGEVVSTWNIRLNQNVPLLMDLNGGLGSANVDLSNLILRGLTISGGAGDMDVRIGQQTLNELMINAGVGRTNLYMNGAIQKVVFRGGAGPTELHLEGPWTTNATGQFDLGLGSTVLYLPKEVGIRIDVAPGISSVDAAQFKKEGNVYTNDLYNQAPISFDFKVNSGVGSLSLRLAE